MTPVAQVIGFGPAALGLPLAAERVGELDRLAELGIVFIDAAGHDELRRGRLSFVVESNSPARDFLAGVHPAGRFAAVLHRPAGIRLAADDKRWVLLTRVRDFLADVAEEITGWLDEGAGTVHYGRHVARVRCNNDGSFTSLEADGRPVADAHAVILATGASLDVRIRGVPPERVLPSSELLAGRLDRVLEVIAMGLPVVIVGGSHSGFSVANLLIEQAGAQLRRGHVTLIHRGIALGFDTLTDALSNPLSEGLVAPLVCPDTGMVNRFRGLRGRSRELCLQILSGAEARIRLCPANDAAAQQSLAEAALVIHARGYSSAVPEIVTADGRPIALRGDRGGIAVDDEGRVFTTEGPLPGVYGLGIGFAHTSPHGERQVALNVFHGRDARTIVQSLLERMQSTNERTQTCQRP